MVRRSFSAATLIALAASWTPALGHVAPFSGPDPAPLPVRFLISIALMAVAGAVIVWQGAAVAREALAHSDLQRQLSPKHPGPRHHDGAP